MSLSISSESSNSKPLPFAELYGPTPVSIDLAHDIPVPEDLFKQGMSAIDSIRKRESANIDDEIIDAAEISGSLKLFSEASKRGWAAAVKLIEGVGSEILEHPLAAKHYLTAYRAVEHNEFLEARIYYFQSKDPIYKEKIKQIIQANITNYLQKYCESCERYEYAVSQFEWFAKFTPTESQEKLKVSLENKKKLALETAQAWAKEGKWEKILEILNPSMDGEEIAMVGAQALGYVFPKWARSLKESPDAFLKKVIKYQRWFPPSCLKLYDQSIIEALNKLLTPLKDDPFFFKLTASPYQDLLSPPWQYWLSICQIAESAQLQEILTALTYMEKAAKQDYLPAQKFFTACKKSYLEEVVENGMSLEEFLGGDRLKSVRDLWVLQALYKVWEASPMAKTQLDASLNRVLALRIEAWIKSGELKKYNSEFLRRYGRCLSSENLYKIGRLLLLEGEKNAAAIWYERAAEKGYLEAHLYLPAWQKEWFDDEEQAKAAIHTDKIMANIFLDKVILPMKLTPSVDSTTADYGIVHAKYGWNRSYGNKWLSFGLQEVAAGRRGESLAPATKDIVKRLSQALFNSTQIRTAESIQEVLAELENGTNPSGLIALACGTKDHGTMLTITKQTNGTYTLTHYNSGGGVAKYHYPGSGGRYQLFLKFTGIPFGDLCDKAAWTEILKQKNEPFDKGIGKVYEMIAYLAARGILQKPEEESEFFALPQNRGTCAVHGALAMIRYIILSQSDNLQDNLIQYKVVKSTLLQSLWIVTGQIPPGGTGGSDKN